MKAYVIQKGDKYFVGGKMFEWSYDLQKAYRFLKKEKAEGAIQKYGCLENSTIIDCVIKYEDVYTFIKKDDSSTRPLTPEILTAAGYTIRHENEAVANFEKCVDEVWVEIDWRKRINKIDVQCDGVIKTRLDIVTVGEFNTLLDIVKLQKFKI